MESKTALVRAKCRIELDSIAAVGLHLALVILPCDSELNDTLWDSGDLQRLLVLGLLLEEGGVFEGRCKLYELSQWPSIAD